MSEAVLDFSRSARLQAIVDCVPAVQTTLATLLEGPEATAKIPFQYGVDGSLFASYLSFLGFSDSQHSTPSISSKSSFFLSVSL